MMKRLARIIRCPTGCGDLQRSRLPGQRNLSDRPQRSKRALPTHDAASKGWDMLRVQQHVYDTMFKAGEVETESYGAPHVTDALIEGLRLQWAYGHPYTPKGFPLLTHDFHSYPAGMQPATASHLLSTVLPGKSVFDPFVGGGTVVLEAMRAGRLGVGSDISPLALFVSRGRCWTASDPELEELRQASQRISLIAGTKTSGAHSRVASGGDWEMVKAAIGDYLEEERSWHGKGLERALWFVFAVARSRGAKARYRRQRGRPGLVAAQYFQSVCHLYADAVAKLTMVVATATTPSAPPTPVLVHRDARTPVATGPSSTSASPRGSASFDASRAGSEVSPDRTVEEIGGIEPKRDVHGMGSIPEGLIVDAVLTSPPYPGVYDYLGHARQARSQLGDFPGARRASIAEVSASLGSEAEEACGSEKVRAGRDGPSEVWQRCGFVESPVPGGRDWPSDWTNGEIGAKSNNRRLQRQAISSMFEVQSEDGAFSTRAGTRAKSALATNWENDQKRWLMETTRVLRADGGRMAVMIGNGDGIDTRSSLIRDVLELNKSKEEGIVEVIGWATLKATEGARRNMRTEHLVLLQKS